MKQSLSNPESPDKTARFLHEKTTKCNKNVDTYTKNAVSRRKPQHQKFQFFVIMYNTAIATET